MTWIKIWDKQDAVLKTQNTSHVSDNHSLDFVREWKRQEKFQTHIVFLWVSLFSSTTRVFLVPKFRHDFCQFSFISPTKETRRFSRRFHRTKWPIREQITCRKWVVFFCREVTTRCQRCSLQLLPITRALGVKAALTHEETDCQQQQRERGKRQ